MENTVNKRILMLKTDLGLGNSEFATKANISTTTLWNIQNEGDIAPKTIKNICEALNVSKEWLLTGKGKMFLEPKEVIQESSNPYKDALVSELKQQVNYLQEMLKMALGGKLPANFSNALEKAARTFLFPNISQGTVSRGRS